MARILFPDTLDIDYINCNIYTDKYLHNEIFFF